MSESYTVDDCLTAEEYAKTNGLNKEIVEKAIRRAKGLVVKHENRRISVIISTRSKGNTPRIHPSAPAQEKFKEIINKITKGKEL
ncbi:MAG: hypothetical protein J5742_02220 [Alphaproteobacteria bacterium]|nr:hypothetical protein [Alphaproteobacteria bacterium]